MNRQDIGKLGEKIALKHLQKKGFKLQTTNYRCKSGEIDIICKKKDCMVFVEVRTKTGSDYGTPEESITAAKLGKLVNAALSYLIEQKKNEHNWRIDFVAVELDSDFKVKRIEHIENALGY